MSYAETREARLQAFQHSMKVLDAYLAQGQDLPQWTMLQRLHHELCSIEEGWPQKFDDGEIQIYLRMSPNWDNGFIVTMGGYSVGNWPRHVAVGNFKTEDDAKRAVIAKLRESLKIVETGPYGYP